MKVRSSLLTLAALAAVPFVAKADSVPRPAMQLQLKSFEVPMTDYAFPSGLRVVFQPDHTQPVVAVTMMIDHGSTDDPVGKEGIAHLVEHLWFRSVHKDENGKDLPKVWDLLREIGANLNATTANDRTNYLTTAPIEHLDGLLRLESLRMREPVRGVTDENIKIEREVVRNELRLRMENGGGDALRYLSAKLYPPGHPYGRETIGTHDSLNAITLADVQAFTDAYYKPSETTIVVIGDFDLKDAPKLLGNFGIDQLADPKNPTAEIELVKDPKPRISGPSEEPPAPPQPLVVKGDITGLTEARAGIDKPALIMGWSLPGAYRDDEVNLGAAVQFLNFALGSELNPSWAWQTGAQLDSVGCFPNPGTLSISAICWIETSKPDEAAQLAERAMNGLGMFSTTDEAMRAEIQNFFSTLRQQQMAAVLQDVDLVSDIFAGRATMQADYLHFTGNPAYFSKQIELANSLSFEKVRAIAEKYFTRQRAVGVVIRPYEEGDVNIDTSNAQYRGARRDDVLSTVLSEEQLNDAFIKKSTLPPDTKKMSVTKLANGMELVVMPHSQAPILKTELYFHGGSYGTLQNEFSSAHWMTRSTVNPLRVAGFPDMGGGNFNTTFAVSGSAGNLPDVLYALRDRVDNVYADTNGKIDWADAMRGAVTDALKEPEQWAEHLRMAHILPGHWMGTLMDHAKIKEMFALSNSAVNDYLATLMRPERATLFVVGNVSVDEAKKAADTYFGKWSGWGKAAGTAKIMAKADPPTAPQTRKLYVLDKANRSQSQVGYVCQLAMKSERDHTVGAVMADAISESTWLALREQTGASYGAGAGTAFYDQAFGILTMGVSVQNDTAGMAAKVFIELAEQAQKNQLNSKTIQVVKYNRAQQYVQGHQSTSQMLNRLVSIMGSYHWSQTYFDRYPDILSSVHGSDFAPILAPCIGHEAVTLIGPKEVIVPQVEKLGYPYEVVDLKKVKTDYYTTHGLKLPKEKDEDKK